MTLNSRTCAHCGKPLDPHSAEEEAEMRQEYESKFGIDFRPDEVALICDDCFQEMNPEHHLRQVENAAAETLRSRLEGNS